LVDQAEIIALDLGDTVRINKTFSVGSPSQIYQNVTVEHIDHRISPQAHEITYKFSPASFSTLTKTATGSGTSSQTAIGLHIADRTAVGSGSATTGDTAVGLHIAPRTATGDGAGTSTSAARTATGSGTGSETATQQLVALLIMDSATSGILNLNALGEYNRRDRSATGSGGATAGSSAVGVHVSPRTATGSGSSTESSTARNATESRTATGSGTGAGSSTGASTLVLVLDSANNGKLNTNTLSAN
jgi:hypothetical protein